MQFFAGFSQVLLLLRHIIQFHYVMMRYATRIPPHHVTNVRLFIGGQVLFSGEVCESKYNRKRLASVYENFVVPMRHNNSSRMTGKSSQNLGWKSCVSSKDEKTGKLMYFRTRCIAYCRFLMFN